MVVSPGNCLLLAKQLAGSVCRRFSKETLASIRMAPKLPVVVSKLLQRRLNCCLDPSLLDAGRKFQASICSRGDPPVS